MKNYKITMHTIANGNVIGYEELVTANNLKEARKGIFEKGIRFANAHGGKNAYNKKVTRLYNTSVAAR